MSNYKQISERGVIAKSLAKMWTSTEQKWNMQYSCQKYEFSTQIILKYTFGNICLRKSLVTV